MLRCVNMSSASCFSVTVMYLLIMLQRGKKSYKYRIHFLYLFIHKTYATDRLFFQCKMWISVPMFQLDKSKQKEISLKKHKHKQIRL